MKNVKGRRGTDKTRKARRLSALTLALPDLPHEVLHTGARHGTDEVDTPLPRREAGTPVVSVEPEPEPEPEPDVAEDVTNVCYSADSPWARFSLGDRAFYQNSALRLRSLEPPPDSIGIKLSKKVGESGAPSREQFEKHYSTLCRRREMQAKGQPHGQEQQQNHYQHQQPPQEEEKPDQSALIEVTLDPEQKAWLASKQEQYDTLTARLANGVPGPVRPHLVRADTLFAS